MDTDTGFAQRGDGELKPSTDALKEWAAPIVFIVCASWVIWHMPAYILTLAPHENPVQYQQVLKNHNSKDVMPNLPGVFGGIADVLDWVALALLPILFILGLRTVRIAPSEFPYWKGIDRIAIFTGRVTMMLVVLMTCVMLYEVFLRYALESPTLWANELTLWIGGFVFLLAGFYSMQQRCHIRIYILYDLMPRSIQRAFDIAWTVLFAMFAFLLVFGSYKQVFLVKFYLWEKFGTIFDSPLPATIQPAILIVVVLVAIQAILNLIADWNLDPESHLLTDDIDQDEIQAIKRAVEDS